MFKSCKSKQKCKKNDVLQCVQRRGIDKGSNISLQTNEMCSNIN